MSCFDTVEFRCPGCGTKNSLQTKDGKCNLDTYQLNGQNPPPPQIIGPLASERVDCVRCKETIGFAVTAFAIPFVVEDEEPDENYNLQD